MAATNESALACRVINNPATDYLVELSAQRFWGLVTLKFENGQIVHIRQEINLKPSELSGAPRKHYGPRT